MRLGVQEQAAYPHVEGGTGFLSMWGSRVSAPSARVRSRPQCAPAVLSACGTEVPRGMFSAYFARKGS